MLASCCFNLLEWTIALHCIDDAWIDHIGPSRRDAESGKVVVRTQYIAIIVPKEGDQYTHNAHTRAAAAR